MSDLGRRVQKLEEITGDGPRGTVIIRVNAECKHAKSCTKIDNKVEEALANGPVVRLTSPFSLHMDSGVACYQGCSSFEKKEGQRNEFEKQN